MRIISGKYRGRRLPYPKKFNGRPTTDYAKTGLFNILNNYFDFESVDVLDLFSGTGNISFEFASRGSNRVHAVEIDSYNVTFLQSIKRMLEIDSLNIYRSDVFVFLRHCRTQYDIIFADSPFDLPNKEEIHRLVVENKLLKKDGWLIIEHDRRTRLNELEGYMREKKYGQVIFSFFCLSAL